jgi:CBS domain-containing protein
MPRVRELMTPSPVKVPEDTPVAECARVLWRLGIRHLPVVDDDGVFVGVVSDFDLLQQGELVSDEGVWADRGAGSGRAGAHARTLAHTCTEDDDLLQTLSALRDEGHDVAVVLDADRRPVGILTEHDAVRWTRAFLDDMPFLVEEGGSVHGVDLYEPGFAAFDAMVEHGIRHVLVYDQDTLAGVISWRDLVVEDVLGWGSALVRDLLRSGTPVTLPVGSSTREIAERMVQHKVGCLPLVDAEGRVKAVVGRGDLVAAILGHLPRDTGGRGAGASS